MINICKKFFYLLLFLSICMFFYSLNFMILNKILIFELEMLKLNSSLIEFVILLDWMSLLFMSFVLFISSMVIFYSFEYMGGDIFMNRFILLVLMFVLSMMLLIISPNLISILLGWDGLGLVSYCLVIYYQNLKSYNAGMLTVLTNRLGDVALLMSIAWMLNYGSWNYTFYLEVYKNSMIMDMITWLVILSALTKSAQIPFSSWLPAAMAAPTPVSSLVHSSTLVTAGVYLLIRFNYSFNSSMMYVLLFLGCMTMFMSGLGANLEFDLKKIIALSTLSQLGLMMSILALGSYELAFFHLLTHALFKALLFMCAGNIIHNSMNFQDIRFMGNLSNLMPLSLSFFNISNLSLCGLPFLSGFYSKDLIVEVLSMDYLNLFIYFIFYVSIGLTVCYSFRLIYYLCLGEMNTLSLNNLSDNNMKILLSMGGLIYLVIFMGSMLMWVMFYSPFYIYLPFAMKIMTLICIISGIFIGYEMSKFLLMSNNLSIKFYSLSLFLANMWYMPYLSTYMVNLYPSFMGSMLYKLMDQGWSEYYGSQNMHIIFMKMSNNMQKIFINNIKLYFLLMIMMILMILIFV
uniref:NADH-ubiquinone oxidoreductase chain 5 n=1 Tax=Lissodema cursor TaxID=1586495 RepID=A0A343C356_9CUCU|nr:NADH dehydrogenase subunit 5 [Lissodema cursor]